MGKINKTYKYLKTENAQSALEYALILPLLFLMILAILELGLLWHQYNTIEMVTQNISANVSLDDTNSCISRADMDTLLNQQTALLNITLSARNEVSTNVYTYQSNEKYADGETFLTTKIDCSNAQSASVQTSAYYKMMFFAASLPNFGTGGRIVVIPDRVKLTSDKIVTINKY